MTHLNIRLQLTGPDVEYFDACARIRGIAPSALVRRLLEAIGDDQMVAAILDDAGEPVKRRRSERTYRVNGKLAYGQKAYPL